MSISKKLIAALAACALCAPVAGPAGAYDQICFKQQTGYTTNGVKLRRVDDRDTEHVGAEIHLKPPGRFAISRSITWGFRKCMDTSGVRQIREGDAFYILQDVESGRDKRCHPDNDRDNGVARWPGGGGTLELQGSGHAADARCRIDNPVMWSGCARDAYGGFAQAGCKNWAPQVSDALLIDHIVNGEDLAYARHILENGGNIHATPYDGDTPLHAAIRLWRKDYVRLLREHGASPLRTGSDGRTVVRQMFQDHRDRRDFMEMFRLMFAPEQTSKSGKAREVYGVLRRLLNAKIINEGMARGGVPGVIEIVLAKRPDILEFALENGGDANAVTHSQYSPLHHAVKFSQRMTRALLAKGADPNRATINGWGTPMHWTVHPRFVAEGLVDGKRVDIVKDMLDAGGDPNSPAVTGGLTPLHYAAIIGDAASVASMLDAGGNPNLADYKGKTALHHAANGGHGQAVNALLKGGADAAATERDGLTAAELAERNGHTAVAANLRKK